MRRGWYPCWRHMLAELGCFVLLSVMLGGSLTNALEPKDIDEGDSYYGSVGNDVSSEEDKREVSLSNSATFGPTYKSDYQEPAPLKNDMAHDVGPLTRGEYHYPYRPKFPAHPAFGICNLEDFEFDRGGRLGRGGFGQVFKAVHVKTRKVVAIKVISAKSIRSRPKHVENEETIQKVLHNNYVGQLLCTIKGPRNEIYFILEYFPGDNLAKRMPLMYPLSRDLLIKYMAQILIGLRYMHSYCIVYRDLKAENIMLDVEDNVKLIDFGLSVYDCDDKITNLAGTLEYMAPEVAARRNYGRASDYYSLAVLVYLLRMHKLPYRHEKTNKDEFTAKIASGEITIPETGDAEVDQVISILANRDAQQRWIDVYVKFKKFQGLPLFKTIDWSYYLDRAHTIPETF